MRSSSITPGKQRNLKSVSWSFLFSLFLLAGCVLPPDPSSQPSWVAPKELMLVGLVKDGLGFAASGRLVDSELSFLSALYLEPNSPNIELNLVVVLEREGRIDEALALIDSLKVRYPTSVRFREAHARLLALSGSYELAEKEYLAATEIAENDPRQSTELAGIYRSLSSLNYKIGREEDAICYALEEARVAPTKEAYLRVGKLYNGADYPKLSIKNLEAGYVAGVPRGDPEIIRQLAISYIAMGDMEVADKFISRALRSHSDALGAGFELLLLRELVPELAKVKRKSEPVKEGEEEIPAEVEQTDPEDQPASPFEDPRVTDLEQRATLVLYWPSALLTLFEQRFAEFRLTNPLPVED